MCVFPTAPHLLHPSKWFPLCCSAHISKPSKWFPPCPHLKASVPESFHVCACPVPCVCPSKWFQCSLLCTMLKSQAFVPKSFHLCVCPSKWSQCSLLCTMITSQSFCSKSFHLCISPSKWSQCSLLCTLFQHLKAYVPNSFHLCVCPASAVWATWQQPFKWQSIKWTWDGTK